MLHFLEMLDVAILGCGVLPFRIVYSRGLRSDVTALRAREALSLYKEV